MEGMQHGSLIRWDEKELLDWVYQEYKTGNPPEGVRTQTSARQQTPVRAASVSKGGTVDAYFTSSSA